MFLKRAHLLSYKNIPFGMSIVLQFNQMWYLLFFAFLLSWLVLLISRKGRGRGKEFKEQLCLALIGVFTLLLMEIFAVSMNLWYYVPGNWPIILWPTYLVGVLFGYQLVRFIEDFSPKLFVRVRKWQKTQEK